MSSKKFSQERKLAIVKNAVSLDFKEAARIAGVHYTTVYDWQRDLKGLGKEAFLAYKPSYPGAVSKLSLLRRKPPFLIAGKTIPVLVPAKSGESKAGGDVVYKLYKTNFIKKECALCHTDTNLFVC